MSANKENVEDIVFLLKSYRKDIEYYHKLVDSFIRFNADNIKMYVVVPEDDCELFKVDDDNIHILNEKTLIGSDNYVSKTCFSKGYIDQQIIKLSFWELGLCENYFCIDTDSTFIKYFHKADFINALGVPYTIFYDDCELMTDPKYYAEYGKARMRYNTIIRDYLDIADDDYLFSCHGFAIISSRVMQSFKEKVLEVRKVTYRDLLEKAPIEFTWYNYWLQKSRVIAIYPKSPLFKTYHTKKQFLIDVDKGVTKKELLRYYLGIVINSNFGRGNDGYDF